MDWLSWLVIVVVLAAVFAYLGHANLGAMGGPRRGARRR